MESILTSIKKLLGLTEEDTSFDSDIVIYINSIFTILNQIGIGPSNGYFINDKNDLWNNFTEDVSICNLVKSYIYLKVKLIFDPPNNSIMADAINKTITEYEWRLNSLSVINDT